MTDVEIIKALECCLDTSPLTCKNCPLFKATNSTTVCSKVATKFALDLINRQKAEIERLKSGVNVELDNYASEYDSKIKAEARKELAERLKAKKYIHFCKSGERVDLTDFFNGYIDNVAKEMEGDTK